MMHALLQISKYVSVLCVCVCTCGFYAPRLQAYAYINVVGIHKRLGLAT